jgi:paraquat-inducible protein B
MSKQANKTVIGGFVIGAIVLLVVGVLVFGSGQFLKDHHTFVMYFEGSVKGLDVGASVDFRGVKVGTVKRIILRTNPKKFELEIPVFVDIEPERIEYVSSGGKPTQRSVEQTIRSLVKKGLRAQLQMQSLVTGKLMVQMDYYPNKPIQLVGSDEDYPEIPTVQTDLQELAKRIEKVPIEEIFKKLNSAMEGIEKVMNSPEILHAVQSLNKTMEDIQVLVRNINSRVDPIATGLESTIKDTQCLVRNVDNQVQPLASDAQTVIRAAASAITKAEETLTTIDHTTGQDSPTVYELNQTLKELSAASRAIRLLADHLSQHPESLLRGKEGEPE